METIARKATRKKSDLKRSEAKALFTLLEDPDPYIQKKVMERLSLLGEQSVPLLDEFREGLDDTEARKRISDLIHKLTFYSFENEFLEHLESGLDTCQKLERILLLLCRFDNPTLRTELSRIQLDKMADRLRHSLAGSDGITSTLALFSSYFFGQEYFRGATDDYMHPDNSYLHKVLQRRTGIPISLSLVMIFVARRLGIQVHGVNMPMHFLIRYEDEDDVVLLDPYNRGRVVTEDQCRAFLRGHGITPEPHHFENATPFQILARSIRNLIFSYEKMENTERVMELRRLLSYVVHYEKVSS